MDKRVIFAVAGSGKTTRLIDELNLLKRTLLITYTESNYEEICRRVLMKFGYLPDNITVCTYFTFLNSFCYRPLLLTKMQTKGIAFERPSNYSTRQKLNSRDRYVTESGRIYHARMAKALDVHGCIPALQRRLERYYDRICVDEVQDIGGHDFNLLKQIIQADVEVLLVGDFYQHTYSTSTDGAVNKGLHDSYDRFKDALRSAGLIVDTTSLLKSHRCSTTVCSFIRDKIGVDIYAYSDRTTQVSVVSKLSQAAELHASPSIIKLFFQEHGRYGCHSQNWGESKGRNHYQDVCVVLNAESWKHFLADTLFQMAVTSRNKLYVACSRARGDLYMMPDTLLKEFKKARDVRHVVSA
ncbi:AAA family ATPase [Burkholderia sp. Cy-637]|uniref:AAA family ATPase n=1 Tax=Burkholderia sp. Cy-637 TaxID=2608327 RepID=UPI0014208170|nr:AAA family ATPase [Burkholderia sp. Cy-637]NIF87769.1 AAA family ATPase [Burkholderia sp. Cy-637]